MKNLSYLVLIVLIALGCKNKKENTPELQSLTTAEKIAKAHGFENWDNVSEIAFNFNGKRSWIWNPKTNNVSLLKENDTIKYNRSEMDSTQIKYDRGFINDKFWLLIPFQLVWDQGTTISEPERTKSPIEGIEMNKIILTYGNNGGYTPGDAYDIYYSDDYIIKEWAFRKGNAEKPGLINTFENYQNFNGLKIALDHKKGTGNWNLKFVDVSVKIN